MKKLLILSISTLVLFTGCLKDNQDDACEYNSCNYVVPSAEIVMVQDYLTANSIEATQHCSGLFYRIENPGTGAAPIACSNVSVEYVGKLTNGTVFDETDPGVPVPFNLAGVILGWTNGVPLIKEGGRIILFVPPSLGYGNQPNGPIPASSILIFEVDLIDVM